MTSISIIVPTYREVDSIAHLLRRLEAVRASSGLDLRVLVMDDDSNDGSEALVRSMDLDWVTFVVRKADRGLSKAVLEGLRMAHGDILIVMDADLSHPPEEIPAMVAAIGNGAEIVVGSRFVDGGSTADDWGVLRWLNSRVATLLALPLTTLSDPMSGFFAIRRATFLAGKGFDPIGYKILLELIIKCRCRYPLEIPIHFENRLHGQSKLSLKEQLQYIRHLRRLYTYKYGTWSHLAQFLFVGFSGLLVNLAVLTALLSAGTGEKPAVAVAIGVSMLSNFWLNRRFSFSYARDRSILKQFVGFIAACALGALVNYFVATSIWPVSEHGRLAAIAGVMAGTLFNFVASRFVVFRAKHIGPRRARETPPQ